MSRLNKVEKKSISILGAGWLGLPLANHLLNKGHSVKLATRSSERLDALLLQTEALLFQFDINDLFEPSGFLDSEILIINITSKDMSAFQRLISKIEESSVRKVLFTSSTSVYSNVNTEVMESSEAENALHPLFQIEQLFNQSTQFKTTIVRLAGLVGYSRHPGKWFQNKAVKQPEAPVNLIHRDDCIGIIDAILSQAAWGEVFNACATVHPTKRDFYTAMRKAVGGAPLDFDDTAELSYKIVSNKKVRDYLAYDFVYPDLMQCENFRVVL